MEVLFKTQHGSHLYGLNHADSDEDWYTVVAPVKRKRYKYSKQSIVNGVDSMTVDLPTWLRLCDKGVPQALEAMFAPNPAVDKLTALRYSYRAGGEVRKTYARTIANFIEEGSFKRRRHALRLALNLRDLLGSGRFNPVVKPHEKEWMDLCAIALDDEDLLAVAFSTAYTTHY